MIARSIEKSTGYAAGERSLVGKSSIDSGELSVRSHQLIPSPAAESASPIHKAHIRMSRFDTLRAL